MKSSHRTALAGLLLVSAAGLFSSASAENIDPAVTTTLEHRLQATFDERAAQLLAPGTQHDRRETDPPTRPSATGNPECARFAEHEDVVRRQLATHRQLYSFGGSPPASFSNVISGIGAHPPADSTIDVRFSTTTTLHWPGNPPSVAVDDWTASFAGAHGTWCLTRLEPTAVGPFKTPPLEPTTATVREEQKLVDGVVAPIDAMSTHP